MQMNFNDFFCYLLNHHQLAQAVTKDAFCEQLNSFFKDDTGRQERFDCIWFSSPNTHNQYRAYDMRGFKKILGDLLQGDGDAFWFELPDVSECVARRYFLIRTTKQTIGVRFY